MYWKVRYLPSVPKEILGADGKVILKADTVIEELATDKEGKLSFYGQIYRLALRIISKKHHRHLDLQQRMKYRSSRLSTRVQKRKKYLMPLLLRTSRL